MATTNPPLHADHVILEEFDFFRSLGKSETWIAEQLGYADRTNLMLAVNRARRRS